MLTLGFFTVRHKVWTHYLADATPQIYRFTLRYPKRMRRRDSFGRNYLLAGDQLFLQPTGCIKGLAERYYLQHLRESTATRHIASATCVQSRQIVLELYPDTLMFRHFPSDWGFLVDKHHTYWDSPDGASFPEHVLRFNGAKDIIVFHADWADQEAAIEIARLRGSQLSDFLKIRHVGIAVDKIRRKHHTHIPPQYGTPDCICATEECQDYCKKEPLPSFLSLFPLAEKFYIAGVPSSSIHQPGDQIQAGKDPTGDANCPCPNEGSRHSWPMIRSRDTCGWFVIYDERSLCPFPKFDRIEELRQRWRPHFPYYQALDHLEIRFIQLWDPDSFTNSRPCNGCVYTL